MSREPDPGRRFYAPRKAPRPPTPNTVMLHAKVCACILQAMTDKEIAQAIGISKKYAEAIVRDVRKLHGARNRVALALMLDREARK